MINMIKMVIEISIKNKDTLKILRIKNMNIKVNKSLVKFIQISLLIVIKT